MSRIQWVAGVPVQIDEPAAGAARDTVLMLHGWPDTSALWDGTVAALATHHRCLRFTWPGFGADDPPGAHTLANLVVLLHQVVQEVAGGPVTLLAHDWGCVFGYHFAQRHPALVTRVIGVDIGDAASAAHRSELTLKAKLMVLAYQGRLALAWRTGGALGDRMARRCAAVLRVPTPAAKIRAQMGYPYWITWTGTQGSYRALRPFDPVVPMLFIYGARKPFMFHSEAWAQALAQRPGNRVLALRCGHWVMVDKAAEFEAAVRDWLDAPKVNACASSGRPSGCAPEP